MIASTQTALEDIRRIQMALAYANDTKCIPEVMLRKIELKMKMFMDLEASTINLAIEGADMKRAGLKPAFEAELQEQWQALRESREQIELLMTSVGYSWNAS